MKNFNETEFCHTLSEMPLDTAFVFDDINDFADALYCLFNNAIGSHAPLATKQIKKRDKPQWFTNDIVTLIRIRIS